MDGGELTDWHEGATSTASTDRIVAHVDMDCFYAACERRREPALEGEPVVVGMGFEPGETHGAVATASYEAREYGVDSAMAISAALERLPRKVDAVEDPALDVADAGFYRPVDMEYYESVSDAVRTILHDRAPVVREVSIDEAYLDVTDVTEWETVEQWAARLKDEIRSTVGVPASVGVAPTMSAAKVASDRDKPDGLVVVEPGDVREFFADLPVEDVHGVGPVTAEELDELGIETAGELASEEPDVLEARFGERGLEIYRYARGEDDREVTPRGRPKSLSRESAFTEATDDREQLVDRVRSLAASVADRATSKDALYRTIGIKVVTPPFDVNTRARSLPGPVDEPDLVESVALDLLDEFEGQRVRKVGVRVSNLSFAAGRQASLGGFDGTDDDGESVEPTTEVDDGAPGRSSDGQVTLTGAPWADDEAADDATAGSLEGQTTIDDFRG
ncbi:DNA polymerase IV [Halomicrobium sp. LC1Hm]|uniref:DNA polymerase IV n=1 Tax=Halomicrobium sp. LC1Hm TaxID=2610902 RepID=UPI001298416E|nr:DNA polymerase IV [Halomicrobium sp. LC1Hm]QGA82771.1 DNA polymerase IV [Halomicrobium sp. LC1Hm]